MVSGASQAQLWVFDGQRGLLRVVLPDAAAMEATTAGWVAFAPYLTGDTPPPLSDRDCTQRGDGACHQAAMAYLAAKREVDDAAARLEASRNALTAMATHPKESGAGVTLTRFWKAGSVDYKKVGELKGVDLERYRGKAREEVRVTAG